MRYLLITLLMLPPSAFAADTIGRLFTTPVERASLDVQRQLRKVQELDAATKEEETAAPLAAPADVSVQGYVKRSDGKKGTVWVNRTPLQEDTNTANIEVGKLKGDSNQVQLKVPTTGKQIKLKAGQMYSPDTDSVSEIGAHSNQSGKDVDEGTIGVPAQEATNSKPESSSTSVPLEK